MDMKDEIQTLAEQLATELGFDYLECTPFEQAGFYQEAERRWHDNMAAKAELARDIREDR